MTIARNVLNYFGIGIPKAYTKYVMPFFSGSIMTNQRNRIMSGRQARCEMTVISSVLADFDGKSFLIPKPPFDNTIRTFDDDTAPPSTISSINIMGLTTAAQIAEQIEASLLLGANPFVVQRSGASLKIFQPLGGDSGNTIITLTGDFTGELDINGITVFAGVSVYMFGGASFDVPCAVGPVRAFGQSTADTPAFTQP